MAKQSKTADMPPLKLIPCCGDGGCGFWNVATAKHPLFEGAAMYGSLWLEPKLAGMPKDKPLWVVALRKPDPGYSFALMKEGGIKGLEENPCREWTGRLQKLYKLGYRHVRFHEDITE